MIRRKLAAALALGAVACIAVVACMPHRPPAEVTKLRDIVADAAICRAHATGIGVAAGSAVIASAESILGDAGAEGGTK